MALGNAHVCVFLTFLKQCLHNFHSKATGYFSHMLLQRDLSNENASNFSRIDILQSGNGLALFQIAIFDYDDLTLSSIYTHFNSLKKKSFAKHIVEKGKIAQNEQFHLFPQCFVCNLYLKSP